MPLKVVSLTPFTLYNFAVEACTTGGCTKSSQSSAIRTRSDCKLNTTISSVN